LSSIFKLGHYEVIIRPPHLLI